MQFTMTGVRSEEVLTSGGFAEASNLGTKKKNGQWAISVSCEEDLSKGGFTLFGVAVS